MAVLTKGFVYGASGDKYIHVSDTLYSLTKSASPGQPVLADLLFEGTVPEKKITASGTVHIEGYTTGHTLRVSITAPVAAEVAVQWGMVAVKPVRVQEKLATLMDRDRAAEIRVWITFSKLAAMEQIQSLCSRYHVRLPVPQPLKNIHTYAVDGRMDNIMQLASQPWVLTCSPRAEAQSLNTDAEGITGAHMAEMPVSSGGYGLLGDSVIVGVGDNADPWHIDITDRQLANFAYYTQSGHGIHTTGTVVGGGLVDGRGRGFAPHAKVVNAYFDDIIYNGPLYQAQTGINATNNSYGAVLGNCSYAGTYDAVSQYVDQQMLDNPYLLHIFAAGNDGSLNCGAFPQGYATTAGTYQSSKNNLVVGNVQKTAAVYINSSKGPVKDGRIKPEVSAIGTNLYSTFVNNGYVTTSGTSMACPNVTGAAALITQRYKQLHNGQLPANALLKAVIMNGAMDINLPGPDYATGYGLLNVPHSIQILDNNRYDSGMVANGQIQTWNITVPDHVAKAKIMLYWNDLPALANASSTLINDLDLKVTAPGGTVSLPLVLNPLAGNVLDSALQGADHSNNAEQVILQYPVTGNYQLVVNGYNIPSGVQEFWVVYDFEMDTVKWQNPIGGEKFVSGSATYLYWQAPRSTSNYTIAYSVDNGAGWQLIDNSVAATASSYIWNIPDSLASSVCRLSISRNDNNNYTAISGLFTIIGRPVISLLPANQQCPGSIAVRWNSIPGATRYYAYRKAGSEMQLVDSTTDTVYRFTNLSFDSTYLVSVAAGINGVPGFRAYGIISGASAGGCEGVAHGDLAVRSLGQPADGRQFTTTAFHNNQQIQVNIGNLDAQSSGAYRVYLKVNNDSWDSIDVAAPIAPNAVVTTVFNHDMSQPGNYALYAKVKNLLINDPVNSNDTLSMQVKMVSNPLIDLSGSGYQENFETLSSQWTLAHSYTGWGNENRWDYVAAGTVGRLRAYVTDSVTIGGIRSLSMDQAHYTTNAGAAQNRVITTFNLSSYNPDTDAVRCEFDYRLAAVPYDLSSNYVTLRGADSLAWLSFYHFDTAAIGTVHHSGSLSISNALAAAGQAFSASTQLSFLQKDSSLIANQDLGNGLTIDNFKLYRVTKDVALISVDTLPGYNCGIAAGFPVKIKVANMMNAVQSGIAVHYQVDSNPVVTAVIPSIAPNDTLSYLFDQTADLSVPGTHTLGVWLHVDGDNYPANDSLLHLVIHTSPVITSFPYLENFEQGNGYFYTDGRNNTWDYGVPQAYTVNHAASGTHAWKTNLSGLYKNNSACYLYSPCYDISSLAHPYLSFSFNYAIEAPDATTGDIYDQGFVEYTTDNGNTWQKLGSAGSGYNWYNNDTAAIWTGTADNYWKVTSVPLPGAQVIAFRWVLMSDQGTTYEGMSIDDIHIYDADAGIFSADSVAAPLTAAINDNVFTPFITGDQMMASVRGQGSDVKLQSYRHTDYITRDSQQYFLPRNFVIHSGSFVSPLGVRLFVKDSAMDRIRTDTACMACRSNKEVYQLGITQYKDPLDEKDNSDLYDDTNGVFHFIPSDSVAWVPYLDGYYAAFHTDTLGEFWFNDGGPTRSMALPQNMLVFTAERYQSVHTMLHWENIKDMATSRYFLQRAGDQYPFKDIYYEDAVQDNAHQYEYIDNPALDAPYAKYRLRMLMADGNIYYSPIRTVYFSDLQGTVSVYPNPVFDGQFLTVKWFKPNGQPLQWHLTDILGQPLVHGSFNGNNYSGTGTIDLSVMGLAPGIYILTMNAGDEKWTFKIVYLAR